MFFLLLSNIKERSLLLNKSTHIPPNYEAESLRWLCSCHFYFCFTNFLRQLKAKNI